MTFMGQGLGSGSALVLLRQILHEFLGRALLCPLLAQLGTGCCVSRFF